MADRIAIICPMGTASTPSIQSSATALAANSQRGAFVIQNLGTNPLFVRYGTGASDTVFSLVLKASTVQDDGTGGSLAMENGVVWTGIISVAGISPRYTATEITA